MANQGAKKRKEENEKHIKNLQRVILSANAIYLLIKLVIYFRSITVWHLFGLVFTSLIYKLSYDQIFGMSKPSFGPNGELLDGGYDLKMGGMCSYLHDIIYITVFVQLGSLISEKFWFVYLMIPLFAAWKIWTLFLYPYFFLQQKEEVEDEKSRKKREKQERKMGRFQNRR